MDSENRGSCREYDIILEKNVSIEMRDGVTLAADLYWPARSGQRVAGKFPVILKRTPYDKTHDVSEGRYFARRGYLSVMQDVRGRFQSGGTWRPFVAEAEDGYDTVEWLARQPFCDGNVGTIGGSYCGSSQNALATLNPPHLRAMFIAVGPSNYHTCSMRHNGAFELRWMIYAFNMAATSKEALADPTLRAALADARDHVREWLSRPPLKLDASPLKFLTSYEQWIFDVMTHGEYDGYWKQRGYSTEEYYDQLADVPTCYLGGWYDSYARATLDNYIALFRMKRGPIRLIMGPWTHAGWTAWNAGDIDFGPEAMLDDYDGLRLRWFDRWLKGIQNGVDDEPTVLLFVMGGGDGRNANPPVSAVPVQRLFHGGSWRQEQEWPLPRTQYTNYYLHPGQTLSTAPPENSPPSSYTFDPRDPVPTLGGGISAAADVMIAGAFDQRGDLRFFGCKDSLPVSARSDVLVFQTPPLEADVEVTGPVTVKLWASSSALDTDFTAKLIDVYPPNSDRPRGFELNLTDSITRARYRNCRERTELLEPNRIYEFTIVLYPTSNLFQFGHRIRLDISSSNYPRFDVNPNTGGPLGLERGWVLANNTIYHDSDHPSHIILPIIPR